MILQSLFRNGPVAHPDRRRSVTFPGLVPKKRYADEPVFRTFAPTCRRFGMWRQSIFRYHISFSQRPIVVDDDFLNWEFAAAWSMRSRQQTRTTVPGDTLEVRHTLWLSSDEDVVMCRLRDLIPHDSHVYGR